MISPYGPGWIGGVSKFTIFLSDALRRSGIECEVIVNKGGVRGLTTELRGPKALFTLRATAWLQRHRPQVLHAHGHWHALLPAVLYKSMHRNVKIVFTVHTPPRQASRPGSWLMKKLMARCDVVTAVSEDIVRWLSPHLPRDVRILKIHPGATSLVGGYHQSRRSLAIPDTSYIATFVGPFYWSEKVAGVKLLARSFHEFARRVPESKLFVVGGGPRLHEIRSLVTDLNAGTQVELVGETEDPAPYVQACDVYTHVSYMEGLPLSLLEAMLAGKAIIASRVGDIPELVKAGEFGILVENEQEEIIAALSTLHSDPSLRDRLGKAGQQLIHDDYTWDRVAQRFLAAYNGV